MEKSLKSLFILKLFKIMKKIFYILLLVSLNIVGQGFNFSSPEQLQEVDNFSSDEKGFAEDLPASHFFDKYAPPIISQKGGTCVGFSSLYYGLSIMYNIEHDYTDFAEKYANSFDPYFIYSIVHNADETCDDGLIMYDAMQTLSKIGSKKMFYPSFLTCDSSWDEDKFSRTVKYTEPYKIKNFYFINPAEDGFTNKVKQIVNYDMPVIIGAKITNSLFSYSENNTNGVSSNGLWSPSDDEEEVGGHAMCVVGYDDNRFGGSFKIVNSWGYDFGENGYLWLKYEDFNKYVIEAYVIEPSTLELNSGYERMVFKSGHTYEGQTLNGNFHGYGIYSFNNGTFLIGNFDNGSREGMFVYIDKNGDNLVQTINYSNDVIINSKSRGFSDLNKDASMGELKSYLSLISPETEVTILGEEPDFEIQKN